MKEEGFLIPRKAQHSTIIDYQELISDGMDFLQSEL